MIDILKQLPSKIAGMSMGQKLGLLAVAGLAVAVVVVSLMCGLLPRSTSTSSPT